MDPDNKMHDIESEIEQDLTDFQKRLSVLRQLFPGLADEELAVKDEEERHIDEEGWEERLKQVTPPEELPF